MTGNYLFLLQNLALKEFKVRYRNMSLGILWSVVNPLVMMGILTLLFTKIFPNNAIPHFPVFVLCALVPYNLFSSGLVAGATSILDNAALIKHVPFPREIIPIASVLANAMHFMIQIGLLLVFTLSFGLPVNRYWTILPLLWALELIFVAGLAIAAAALDVYFRDIRYVVESGILVMFWLVPIFYSFSLVPARYLPLYTLNPITAVAQSSRAILLEASAPPLRLVTSLAMVSIGVFFLGIVIFRLLKGRFADYM